MFKPIHLLTTVVSGVILVAVAGVSLAHRVPPPTDTGVVPGSVLAGQGAAMAGQGTAVATQGTAAAVQGTAAAVQGTAAAATGGAAQAPGGAAQAPGGAAQAPGDAAQAIGEGVGSAGPAHPDTAGPTSRAAVTSSTAAKPDAAVGGRSAPVSLEIPSLSVAAPITPVGVADGELQVPDDPQSVGWWRSSVPPGSTSGSTVIDGHIDSAVAGIGALFHLADLGPGDDVSVRTSAGRVVPYVVQARRVYVKSAGLPADIFSQTGPPRLVLISCGGTFDATARSYEENIVVYAVPQAQRG